MSSGPPASVRALVRGPWGPFPLLTIVAGLSAVLLATADTMGRRQIPGASALFWIAFPLAVVREVVTLLRQHRPRHEWIALVVPMGFGKSWQDLLRSLTLVESWADIRLATGQTWRGTVSAGSGRIEARLFRLDDPKTIYPSVTVQLGSTDQAVLQGGA